VRDENRFEEDQRRAAAAEAAAIGGRAGDEELDPSERPLAEAGEGEREGFELAEQDLVEHASHGDQQSAHAVLHDQTRPEESAGDADADDGEAGDAEPTSERRDDER
jgi:hypothetical protein